MARRILVSCLGTNTYTPVRYAAPAGSGEADAPEPVAYTQEARVRGLRTRTPPVELDAVVVLCTDKARETNWERAAGRPEDDGLRDRLRATGHEPLAVPIPDCGDPSELWAFFEALQSVVQPGDELYVDVTHGFRAQPLLLVTGLDYVCRTQGATLREITYGAFEGRRVHGLVQTFDLSAFLVLRDWAAAWARFLESRDLRGLAAVFAESDASLRRRLRGPSPVARLTRPLRDLATALRNNDLRGAPAFARQAVEALGPLRGALDAHEVRPFRSVLDPLEAELTRLVPADDTPTSRMLAQVELAEWSRKGGLYPQALTVLRETVIDLVAARVGLDPTSRPGREHLDTLAGALQAWVREKPPHLPEALAASWSTLLHDPGWARRVGALADRVASARNSVNHGWTGDVPAADARDKAAWLEAQTAACLAELRALVAA